MKRLLGRLLCLIGDHDWTCKASQGIQPSADEVRDGYAGFLRYAAMYCARCGYGSALTLLASPDQVQP
jgi:hypothetical protein